MQSSRMAERCVGLCRVLLNKIVELLSAEPRAGSEVQVVTSGPDSQLSDLSSLSQGLQGDTDDDSVASSK